MKSTRLLRILEKHNVDIPNLRKQEAISRLRTMRGMITHTDHHNRPLDFKCNKKGKFTIYDRLVPFSRNNGHFYDNTLRTYYLKGRVTSYQGDARITYCIVHDKRLKLFGWLSSGLIIIYALLFVIGTFLEQPLIFSLWSLLIALAFCAFICYIAIKNDFWTDYSAKDIEIMKDEMESIINGVRSYDDQDEY